MWALNLGEETPRVRLLRASAIDTNYFNSDFFSIVYVIIFFLFYTQDDKGFQPEPIPGILPYADSQHPEIPHYGENALPPTAGGRGLKIQFSDADYTEVVSSIPGEEHEQPFARSGSRGQTITVKTCDVASFFYHSY
ncbi:MAG: hypothetical protein DRP87_08785 [Spirochaetes bacterium]|nr:MAG: hypothetical protein DRP87_08785 [Spirochaetota bacterium]